jgi:hypothetical protein
MWADPNITASFLPDGTPTEGYTSSLYAMLDAIAPTAVWQREFAWALQTWASVSNLNFRLVADDGSPTGTSGLAQGDPRFGDIRLGAHPLDGYVAYAYYPSSTTKGGDIFLNPAYTLQVGGYPDLYSILLHETGHALGLGHSTEGTVMYAYITGVYTGLTADDIAGIQAIYGARQPDAYDAAAANDGFTAATALTISSTGAATLSADLTSLADVDYFRVAAPANADGTLTVAVDARSLSLLAPKLLIYDATFNLIGSADAGAAYGTAAIVRLSGLTPGQTYYVAADGATNDVFGMGAYRLSVQFGVTGDPGPEPPPDSPPPADRFEPNETPAAARELGKLNSTSQTGLTVHSATDTDYFTFTARSSATYRITIRFTHAKGNLDLIVTDASQRILSAGTGLADNESVSMALVAGQRYYIKVFSPSGQLNVYDLVIEKVGSSAGGPGKGGKGKAMLQGDSGHGTYLAGLGSSEETDHDHDSAGTGRGSQRTPARSGHSQLPPAAPANARADHGSAQQRSAGAASTVRPYAFSEAFSVFDGGPLFANPLSAG